jgi:HAD superfamily hydrolase (TIGR01490 family)
MRTAAFFDIDHTLIGADSGMLFVKYLIERGAMKRRDLLGPAYYTLLYRLNLLDINAVFRRYQGWVRGRAHAEMEQVCNEWYAACVRPTIYPQMAATVDEHRRAGHVVAILSSATTYVGEPLARELGIEHLLANRLVVKDGHLTGEAVQPLCWGAGKAHWARRFAVEQAVDLRQSYFYTDSISDLPMLEIVGQPRVVNPDRLLRRHAQRRGWPIVKVAHGAPPAEATIGVLRA